MPSIENFQDICKLAVKSIRDRGLATKSQYIKRLDFEIKEIKNVMDFARQLQCNTAEDLMREPVWVKMDDTLEQAFWLMHENKLPGLPVIDDHYHLVGYINLLEIMAVCMDEDEGAEAAT